MKVMYRLMALLMILMLLAGMTSAFAADDGYPSSYTYNYDYWGDVRESPDAYRMDQVIYSSALGLEVAMKRPQSLFVQGQDLYVCDTGNNRLLHLTRGGDGFHLVRIIDTIQGTEPATFNTPSDVFVDEEGNIYVCDTNNQRVVMVDKDLNFLKAFTKPTDSTFDQSLNFLPNKLVVDTSGRVFCLATNVNKGLVKFEADTTFTGYVGANKVVYNFAEYIWKEFFTTKAQRAQQESFVPTEYCNVYMDEDSFIYATNISFEEGDLIWDKAMPIRRLNGIGNNIHIKNDRYPPIGDLYWVEGSVEKGPSKLIDITVLENDIYVAADRTRGRIFGYDSQGIMLWAFGSQGNTSTTFNSIISIEHMGRDLIVLDQTEADITVFTPTEYGNLIYDASADYLRGDYDGSADKWEEVLRFNANYNLAFIGIGRSLMRQEKFKEAMDYFEMAHDRDNYGRAFRQYRKIWVEENIGWMALALAVVMIVPLIIRTIKRTRMEVEIYERSKVGK